MIEEDAIAMPDDAETEFRRRLAAKLLARGYKDSEIEQKILELLRKGVKLRLNVDEILNSPRNRSN